MNATMNIKYLDAARQQVPSTEILINMVSRRVRQLAQGHRPLTLVEGHMDPTDIALKEISEGKFNYEIQEIEKPEGEQQA
jgi:DNA-directed RNA polymerase subunit omega